VAERKLQERFNNLEERMQSVESLTKFGTGNDLKFYIFDYDPKDELSVRDEVKKIKKRNNDIVEFDLYEMIIEIIKEEGYWERILKLEKEYPSDIILSQTISPLIAIEENVNQLIDKFKAINDHGDKIVLITGVGKAYPIIRSHSILNNLHSVFKNNPVVMMYPGRYDIKDSMTLQLFEKLDDKYYYRAFSLVERGKK
jgi:hypothetical protein